MIKNDRRKKFVGRRRKKIRVGMKMKGGKMEMDGRRDSSKVRRDNENISYFFSRTRAPKTKN